MVEVPPVPVNFHRLLSREKDEIVNSLEESTFGNFSERQKNTKFLSDLNSL